MMNMETAKLKDCPLCGEECFERFEEQDGKHAFVIRCGACSLVYGLEFKNTRELAEGNAVFIRHQFNTRTPHQPQWERMTEETTFGDGEELLAIIRRMRVCVEYVLDGDEFVAAIPSSNSVSVGFQRHKISKFIRIPK